MFSSTTVTFVSKSSKSKMSSSAGRRMRKQSTSAAPIPLPKSNPNVQSLLRSLAQTVACVQLSADDPKLKSILMAIRELQTLITDSGPDTISRILRHGGVEQLLAVCQDGRSSAGLKYSAIAILQQISASGLMPDEHAQILSAAVCRFQSLAPGADGGEKSEQVRQKSVDQAAADALSYITDEKDAARLRVATAAAEQSKYKEDSTAAELPIVRTEESALPAENDAQAQIEKLNRILLLKEAEIKQLQERCTVLKERQHTRVHRLEEEIDAVELVDRDGRTDASSATDACDTIPLKVVEATCKAYEHKLRKAQDTIEKQDQSWQRVSAELVQLSSETALQSDQYEQRCRSQQDVIDLLHCAGLAELSNEQLCELQLHFESALAQVNSEWTQRYFAGTAAAVDVPAVDVPEAVQSKDVSTPTQARALRTVCKSPSEPRPVFGKVDSSQHVNPVFEAMAMAISPAVESA